MHSATSRTFKAAAFIALLAFSLLAHGETLQLRPFDGDNLYVLQWADGARLADVLRVDPQIYPEWRPVAYATVLLQYQFAGLENVAAYFAVNLLLWTLCAWLVFRIVVELTASASAGVLAAAFAITSQKSISALVIIVDRQNSLACLFGLLAWLWVVRQPRISGWRFASVVAALIASALSKEYGLAFAIAVAAYGAWERRRELVATGVAAIAAYSLLRVLLVSGGLGTYCEDHGYFFLERRLCFDPLNTTWLVQAVYNVAATTIDTLLPGIFTTSGTILVSERRLLVSAPFLALALAGSIYGSREARLGILVVVFNALLSFMLFRARNHVVGVCGLAVAIGCGLPVLAALRHRIGWLPARGAAIAVLVVLLSIRTGHMRERLSGQVWEGNQPNPCAEGVPRADWYFLSRVWEKYEIHPVCDNPESTIVP